LAQETRLKYIGIEAGMIFIESEMSSMDYVRGDIPSYYGGNLTNSLTSLSYKSFIGIKSEFFSLNDRFGLSGGLRFSRMYSCVGKNDYWTNSTNYFYCLYRQDGVNTEYLKVKEINQTSDYIGIPIEIRYFSAKRPHLFRIYFKIGAEINYLIQTQKDIVFYNNAMNSYKEDLTAKIGQPKTFYSSIYGGGGIRIGKELKPSISIEACMPYLFLTSKSFGLVNPIFGGGFQLNVQIPIKSKLQ
jgi:hypothetical protein